MAEERLDEHDDLLNQIIAEAKEHKACFEISSEYEHASRPEHHDEHKNQKCKINLAFYMEDDCLIVRSSKSFGDKKTCTSTAYDVEGAIEKLKHWQEIMEGFGGDYEDLKAEIFYDALIDHDSNE